MKRIHCLMVAGALLLLAWSLRLSPLASAGIYADEGTQLSIARALGEGRLQYLAIQDSTLLFAKFPLFPGLLALWGKLLGATGMDSPSLFLSRLLVLKFQLLSVALLIALLRRNFQHGERVWLTTFWLVIFPVALRLGRYVFSYHLLATLMLLLWFFWQEYQRRPTTRNLVLMAGALGAALVTDLLAWTLLPIVVYRVGRRSGHRHHWPLTLGIASLPSLVFLIGSYALAPEALAYDLAVLFMRLTALTVSAQLALIGMNLRALFWEGAWLWLGLLGVFALPSRLRLDALWFFALPLLAASRSVALTGLAAYHILPWLPWVALTTATLVTRVGSLLVAVWQPLQRFRWVLLVLLMAAISRLGSLPILSAPPDPYAVVQLPIDDVAAMVEYLAERRRVDELILATPALAWRLPGAVADYQMALAAEGWPSVHLPKDLPKERFAYAVRFADAKYAILDSYLFRWALLRMPELTREIAQIEAEWKQLFTAGELRLYKRPG